MPVAVRGSGLSDRLLSGTRSLASGLLQTVLVLFFLLVSGDTFLKAATGAQTAGWRAPLLARRRMVRLISATMMSTGRGVRVTEAGAGPSSRWAGESTPARARGHRA